MLLLFLAGCPESGREKCFRKGVEYYKAIESYPQLSDGRNATDVIRQKCLDTNNQVFGRD